MLPQAGPEHVGPDVGGVLDHVVVLHGADGADRRRAAERVPGVGETAGVGALAEGLGDGLGHDHAAEGHVAGVHALGEAEQVGGHVPVVGREPRTGATEAHHHLVEDQQDPVLVAELAHAGQVGVGRDEHAVGAHHRLEDDRRDRSAPSYWIDLGEVGQRPLALLLGGRRAERRPVEVRPHEVHDAGDRRLAPPPPRLTGERHRAGRGAVVAAVGGQHLVAAGVGAGHADGVLGGLGAAVGEEHPVETLGRVRR